MTELPEEHLSKPRLAAFATLGIATGGFQIPLQLFLPAFYAQSVGLPLQLVGSIFLASRLLAAFSDPVIGWASDRTNTRFGQRKPWIMGGGLLFAVAALAVFLPPEGVGPWWLGIGLFLLCLGWTATATPHYAWGGQLSRQSDERARIQAYIQTGASIGIFVILLLPALFDILGIRDLEIRVHAMGLTVMVPLAMGLLFIGLFFREAPKATVSQSLAKPAVSWLEGTLAVMRDPVLWRIILSDFFVAFGQGCRGAVFVFFMIHFMGLEIASLLLIVQYGFGVFASPLWASISYRLGRVHTLIVAEFIQVTTCLSLLLVTPERLWLLVLLVVAQGLAQGSGNLMLRALIYDVADRHRTAGKGEHAGLFSSVFNITQNAAMAISVAFAFQVIGYFGFDPAGGNSPTALSALRGFFAIAPAFGHLASILVILGLLRDKSWNEKRA